MFAVNMGLVFLGLTFGLLALYVVIGFLNLPWNMFMEVYFDGNADSVVLLHLSEFIYPLVIALSINVLLMLKGPVISSQSCFFSFISYSNLYF
jgi:uncharacterized protein (DUF983 family)